MYEVHYNDVKKWKFILYGFWQIFFQYPLWTVKTSAEELAEGQPVQISGAGRSGSGPKAGIRRIRLCISQW